jgi:hypothetical protein
VLFLLFGSSAAGKSSVLAALRDRLVDVAVHDFDEIGVPTGADTAWRHRANETWVRRALDLQADGTDMLLAAQTPFGELLATPSATGGDHYLVRKTTGISCVVALLYSAYEACRL